ncbi:MAG TPA: hypothetical protein VH277_02575, partial [Gemmatimonadaceae bacterium]|nr:hypothetical protein [Gemmatimonadaceae bacterium]
MSRFTTLFLVGTSLALAACSDSTKVTGPSSLQADGSASFSNGVGNSELRHEFPTREAQAAHDVQNGAGFGGSGTGISYHGGPVLQSGTKAVAVYWASGPIYSGGPAAGTTGSGSADGSLIGAFLRGLGGSPYFNINTTYTNGSGAHIVNSVTYTGYWANNTNVPSNGQSVSDAQMIAMLQGGLNSGKLTYDPSTLYEIFTAGSVNLGGGFGTQYCAYHTHGTVTVGGVSKTILYSAMPYDMAYPASCSANMSVWPNNDPGADAEVNTLAHETEETTTDQMGTAWYDNRGYENADKCAWKWGTTFATSNGSSAN